MSTLSSCSSLNPRQALRLALSAKRDTPIETLSFELYRAINGKPITAPNTQEQQNAVKMEICAFFGVPVIGDRAMWKISLRSSAYH